MKRKVKPSICLALFILGAAACSYTLHRAITMRMARFQVAPIRLPLLPYALPEDTASIHPLK